MCSPDDVAKHKYSRIFVVGMGFWHVLTSFWEMLFPNTRMQEKKEEVRELQEVIRNIERGEQLEREEEKEIQRIIDLLHTLILNVQGTQIHYGTDTANLEIATVRKKVDSAEYLIGVLQTLRKVRRESEEFHMVEQLYVEHWKPLSAELQGGNKPLDSLIKLIEGEFKKLGLELTEEEQLDRKEEQELLAVDKEIRREE